jgi:AraC-like DNA-binding protein
MYIEQLMNAIETKSKPVNGYGSGRPADGAGSADECGYGSGNSRQKIEQSISYMRQHLDKPLQVAKLAALAHVSPSHFFALFKRRTGCAPIDFFIRLRMQHACRLLDETSLNVKEVAAALGYDDPYYFSRVFKAVNHVAPSEYRTVRSSPGNGSASLSLAVPSNGRAVQSGSAGWRLARRGVGIGAGSHESTVPGLVMVGKPTVEGENHP